MSASQRQEMMKNKSTALFLVHQVIWLDLNLGYILEAVITHLHNSGLGRCKLNV